MFSGIYVIFLAICYIKVLAIMPLEEGVSCEENFINVNPLKMMGLWHVVEHTDNLSPPRPSCMDMKFARRTDMHSNMRMDVEVQFIEEDEVSPPIPVMTAGIKVFSNKPFGVSIGSAADVFPPNLMVTTMEKDAGCMAMWTCKGIESSSQKAAWILCKDVNVEESVKNKLKQDISEKGGIDTKYFVPTEKGGCDS